MSSDTSYLLPSEWRALLRNYLIGFALAAIALFLGGMRCQAYLSHRPDPAIALMAKRSAAYRDSLRQEKAVSASRARETAALQAKVASAEAKAAQLHVAAAGADSIKIDSLAHFITALDSTAAPVDTVAYADVQRPDDERHYYIPRFFANAFVVKVREAAAWQQVAVTQHALVENLTARTSLDSTRLEASDSLNASLTRQVDALQRQGHPWCGARCGVALTLTVLTAAAITLHEVRR